MQHKAMLQPPAFVPLRSVKAVSTAVGVGAPVLSALFGTTSRPGEGANKVDNSASTLGVTQRQLSNGLRVSMKPLEAETQKMHVRLYIPGTGVKLMIPMRAPLQSVLPHCEKVPNLTLPSIHYCPRDHRWKTS
jgi:hypothetical protein